MFRKNKIKTTVIRSIITVVILLVAVFMSNVINEPTVEDNGSSALFDNPLVITFLDVGQGDCQLISCNGVNILIDCGEAKYASTVMNYLEDNGVDKIDCFVLSHPHSDHMGAAQTIVSNIDCDKIVLPEFSEFTMPTSKLYENFLLALEDTDSEIVAVSGGDSFSCGDVDFEVFSPLFDSDDYNDMSIVLSATYSETTVLFTGDATVATEKAILENKSNIEADILKVAHHGSSTSSLDEFLDEVSPKTAIISCGENNSYGHPHTEVVNRLIARNIDIFRTDISGTIVCYGDGKTYEVACYNDL